MPKKLRCEDVKTIDLSKTLRGIWKQTDDVGSFAPRTTREAWAREDRREQQQRVTFATMAAENLDL